MTSGVGRFVLALAFATLLPGRPVLAGPAQDAADHSPPDPAAPHEARPAAGSLSLEDIANRIYRRLSEAQAARPGGERIPSVTPPQAAADRARPPPPARTTAGVSRRVRLAWPEETGAEPAADGRARVVLDWNGLATTPPVR